LFVVSNEKLLKGRQMTIQYQTAQFELKREPDHDGVFEGYASVFGVVDQGFDIVQRGAFLKSLSGGRKVKMLWQHDQSQPIGVWDEIKEDERGLKVRGRVLKEVQKGAEAQALLKAGALDSMSIGYRTVEATEEADGRVRKLLEVDLFEISLVTFPMLPEAMVTDVKTIKTEREFEVFLRDAGYSRKQAAALTLHGFKAIDCQRDAVVDDEQKQADALSAVLTKLNLLQDTFRNG
jgi:HK97 family phage prohead protease